MGNGDREIVRILASRYLAQKGVTNCDLDSNNVKGENQPQGRPLTSTNMAVLWHVFLHLHTCTTWGHTQHCHHRSKYHHRSYMDSHMDSHFLLRKIYIIR